MTKKEAIFLLKQINEILIHNNSWLENTHEPLNQAFDMAINALEQQPNDDCVSRADVLKQIKEWRDCEFVKTTNSYHYLEKRIQSMPPVTPTQRWIPLVWDEYPTVDIDGNDDYVYAVDCSVPMPKEDEWVIITDENHNVTSVQYDGYDFGDYVRENILAWQPLPKPYEGEKDE